MKKTGKILTFILLTGLFFTTTKNINAQDMPDAQESDPVKIGWMQGFPPAKDKTLSAVDGSFFNFPALRYSVNHMREFFPTCVVPSSKQTTFEFQEEFDENIDSLKFTPWNSSDEMTFADSLAKNYTDGIIILHKGKIIYEKYFGGLTKEGCHAAMSVTKSFTGTIGAILVAQGILNPNKQVTDYIPELKGSGFDGATVRHVMDMQTAISYSEDYSNPQADVWTYSLAGNPFRPADYTGPKNYYEYLATLKKIKGLKHGTEFGYKTVNAELLGWIISRASGKGLAQLLSELIWIPLGAKYDAYYNVDPSGIAMAGGGLSLNLRDMAVFGEMMRCNGQFNGTQIIPEAAVKDITERNSTKKAQNIFAKGKEYPNLISRGWSYSDLWWITNNKNKAYMARGVHGQAIYIDPTAEMVIVRFASTYLSSNKDIDPISIPAYEAVAQYCMSSDKN